VTTTVAVLGATGSIGRQTLDVVAASGGAYEVDSIGANSNVAMLAEQAPTAVERLSEAAQRPRSAGPCCGMEADSFERTRIRAE